MYVRFWPIADAETAKLFMEFLPGGSHGYRPGRNGSNCGEPGEGRDKLTTTTTIKGNQTPGFQNNFYRRL